MSIRHKQFIYHLLQFLNSKRLMSKAPFITTDTTSADGDEATHTITTKKLTTRYVGKLINGVYTINRIPDGMMLRASNDQTQTGQTASVSLLSSSTRSLNINPFATTNLACTGCSVLDCKPQHLIKSNSINNLSNSTSDAVDGAKLGKLSFPPLCSCVSSVPTTGTKPSR